MLRDKIEISETKRIKDQFKRNIDVLNSYKEYDFQHLKPNSNILILRQSKDNSLLDINGIQIEVSKTLAIGPPKTEYVGLVKTEHIGPKRCS